MRYAIKCGNIIFDYFIGCTHYICNARRSFSDISKREGDSEDDSVSWKGADAGNYRYARLRNTVILSAPHGIPELIAVVVVAVLHVWRRNNLLSIGVGTVLYMVLIQTVF